MPDAPDRGIITVMIEKLKAWWSEFSRAEPGQRFKERYRRRQRKRGHIVTRILLIVFGTILTLGSIVLGPLPGAGFGTAFLGLAILAGELLPVARFLDWAEVKLRRLAKFVQRVWRSSTLGKVAIVAVAVLCVAAFAYLVYRLFFA